jgi:predicted RNA-binding protein Jag
VAHVREMKEDDMLEAVRAAADEVRATQKGVQLPAMNSFHRRLVHNLFSKDPQIQTWSSDDKSRLKRITLLPRRK